MRILFIAIIMLACLNTYGQTINGMVTDKQTGLAISGALITSSKSTVISDLRGNFSIAIKEINDTIRVSMQGYTLYQISNLIANAAIFIALDKIPIALKEVKVSAKRDRLTDSLNNREMFAKSFNSSAPKFKDIVRVSQGLGVVPIAGVTIVPSELVKAITYKHSREYKFKKTLINDEQYKYIDSRFNKGLVIAITRLQADSLSDFMEKYRPTINAIKKMTDYDIRVYIKKSLVEFKGNI